MQRFSTTLFVSIAALGSQAVVAQTTPTTLPSTAAVAQTQSLNLRSLPTVLDARERHQDWHTAAEQAASRIQDPGLKTQFNQRLAGIVPSVAKLLIGHPQDYALVSAAVYRSKGAPDKQAMIAITLDGLDSQLGPNFFADVVAGLPQAPSGEGIPTGLELDTEATTYLLFFLGEKQLEAGAIPHTLFGKSIMVATNRAQNSSAEAQAAADRSAIARTHPAQAQAAVTQAREGPGINAVNNRAPINNGYDGQPAGYVETGVPSYGYASNYPLVNDGYYYPGIGVPYVILSGEGESTMQIQQRQIAREHALERAYHARAGDTGNGAPAAGIRNAPVTGNSTTPITGNGTAQQTGRSTQTNVMGNPNVRQGQTPPRTFPQPGQPGGAPAGSKAPAPAAPANTPNGGAAHPAPGAPGGAPANNGGKK